jgi:hypothetical protein
MAFPDHFGSPDRDRNMLLIFINLSQALFNFNI